MRIDLDGDAKHYRNLFEIEQGQPFFTCDTNELWMKTSLERSGETVCVRLVDGYAKSMPTHTQIQEAQVKIARDHGEDY